MLSGCVGFFLINYNAYYKITKSTDMEYLNAHISPLYVLVLTISTDHDQKQTHLFTNLHFSVVILFIAFNMTNPLLEAFNLQVSK